MTIPIVRLEVERMETHICTAIMEESARMDRDIRAAVKAACDPANIKRVLEDAVAKTLKNALERTVENYFLYGPGQEALQKAVAKKLADQRFID
jgi:hypothetical protein